MSNFKCKVCGDELDVKRGKHIAKCSLCGTSQSVPILFDEESENTYLAACKYRRSDDFVSAYDLFKKLIEVNPEEADFYWSAWLSKYGITYVTNSRTHKKTPVMNRTLNVDVLEDEDYVNAIEYANSEQESIFEKEALNIRSIQKVILETAQKEKPFDIFICAKVYEDDSDRTVDSMVAENIYSELTGLGYRVFFPYINLVNVNEANYETLIFNALNTAKVMVLIGSSIENIEDPWVKNEWSRFVDFSKNSDRKLLLCCNNVDENSLNKRLVNSTIFRISSSKFKDELISKIKATISVNKLDSTDAEVKPDVVVKESVEIDITKESQNSNNIISKVIDDDTKKAEEVVKEKVLGVGLAAKNKVLSKISTVKENISNNIQDLNKNNFNDGSKAKKVEEVKVNAEESKKVIKPFKNKANVKEDSSLESQYLKATELLEYSICDEDVQEAYAIFDQLGDYKDSNKLKQTCLKMEKEFSERMIYKQTISEEDFKGILIKKEQNKHEYSISLNDDISCYADTVNQISQSNSYSINSINYKDYLLEKKYEDSDVDIYKQNIQAKFEEVYNKAVSTRDKAVTKEDFLEAARYFAESNGYKDSYDQALECQAKSRELGRLKKDSKTIANNLVEEPKSITTIQSKKRVNSNNIVSYVKFLSYYTGNLIDSDNIVKNKLDTLDKYNKVKITGFNFILETNDIMRIQVYYEVPSCYSTSLYDAPDGRFFKVNKDDNNGKRMLEADVVKSALNKVDKIIFKVFNRNDEGDIGFISVRAEDVINLVKGDE